MALLIKIQIHACLDFDLFAKMKWKIEHDRQVLHQNFERLEGWICTNSETDWNIYWASPPTVQALFHPEKGKRLRNDQVVNHFPNYYEFTRKDLMAKHIKRYFRTQKKIWKKQDYLITLSISSPRTSFKSIGAKSNRTDPSIYHQCIANFLPTSYTLPFEYNLFLEEFRRSQPNSLWIMKPCNGAQGKGIFIVDNLNQIKKWSNSSKILPTSSHYVISRYIDNPLLIEKKKFDLRIYGASFFLQCISRILKIL